MTREQRGVVLDRPAARDGEHVGPHNLRDEGEDQQIRLPGAERRKWLRIAQGARVEDGDAGLGGGLAERIGGAAYGYRRRDADHPLPRLAQRAEHVAPERRLPEERDPHARLPVPAGAASRPPPAGRLYTSLLRGAVSAVAPTDVLCDGSPGRT